MSETHCPRCGAPLEPDAEACRACGYAIASGGEGPSGSVGPGPTPERATEPATTEPAATREVADPRVVGTAPPWEVRRGQGFWSALWATWRDSVFRPVEFFRRLPPRGGYGPALGFAILMSVIGLFFSVYWGVLESVITGSSQSAGSLGVGILMLGALVFFIFMLPVYVGGLFVTAAVIHLGFMGAGAGRQGYEGTFRALAYSTGPAVFAIFPFFGPLVSGIWSMALWFIGLREVQRTTNGRATLGFLIPMIALIVLVLLFAALMAALVGSMSDAVRV